MESSEEEDDFGYHEGITPQSRIHSLYQSNTEKGTRKLCCDLLDLKDSVENLHGNSRSKYLAFLRLSEEVIEMQHELLELRKHISAQGIMVQDLLSGACVELEECIRTNGLEDPPECCKSEFEDVIFKNTTDANTIFLEKLDTLLAEHRTHDALEVLELEERTSSDLSLKPAISKRKAILEEQFIAATEQHSIGDTELKKAVIGLVKLGKAPLAQQTLLKSYTSRIRRRVEALVSSFSLYPGTYPATLSKTVFSIISLAAKESGSTFGDDPVCANIVVRWTEQEIESFIRLVKDNGPPSETVMALRAASVCVQASFTNCVMLELQGFRLSKLVMVLLRPYMEEVLEMNLRRARRALLEITDSVEDPPLSPRFSSPLSLFAPSSDSVLIRSGLKFIFLAKEMVEQLTPLSIVQFGGSVLSRISQLFDSYIDLLTKSLPSPSEDDGIIELKELLPYKAETDSQQLTLLGVAYSIADELLPMAVSRILNVQIDSNDSGKGPHESLTSSGSNALDFKEWRRQLHHSLDRLRDHFCMQYVLNFIYSREGKARLDARIYVEGEGEDFPWGTDSLPSLPFQALFARLQQLATVAGDVLLGMEKLQKVLLARLTETIVMWLSNEQEFWDVFEDESVSLKPSGLQQLVLDMHFTVEIARFAGFSSRQVLQLASVIVARAVKTFSAKGIDPQSALPEDEWFSEAARAAINKLLQGASGSELSEPEEEQEPMFVHHHHPISDSDDSVSCSSSVDSFHSFVSAEMGDFTDQEG